MKYDVLKTGLNRRLHEIQIGARIWIYVDDIPDAATKTEVIEYVKNFHMVRRMNEKDAATHTAELIRKIKSL